MCVCFLGVFVLFLFVSEREKGHGVGEVGEIGKIWEKLGEEKCVIIKLAYLLSVFCVNRSHLSNMLYSALVRCT